MPRIEKTIFLSYRRTNNWTALAIFQNLNANGYDVFFDYKSIPSGDFEQAIIENVKSRAHFIVVLSPSALERCNETGDWLRREIETAIDAKRNIIPLVMEGFDFGSPATVKALTGKLSELKKYNALSIPAEYFDEAMVKLRGERFLNRPLESVSHPVSDITRQITEEQKSSANEAVPVETEQLTAQEWFERGYVFAKNENFEEASRCFLEAIRLKPDWAMAQYNLGLGLIYLNRYDEAEVAYRKAIELNPSDAATYSNFGLLLHKNMKRYKEAEASYQKAIELNPLDATAYYNLGNLLKNLKRYEEAEAAYRKAIELEPLYAATYSNLGNLLSELKRNEEAEASYRKAIELNPLYAIAYSNLGILLSELKRYDEAETSYRKAIEINPSDADVCFNLGRLLDDLKRYDEAESALRKAIELNPSYANIYSKLFILLNSIKRFLLRKRLS